MYMYLTFLASVIIFVICKGYANESQERSYIIDPLCPIRGTSRGGGGGGFEIPWVLIYMQNPLY